MSKRIRMDHINRQISILNEITGSQRRFLQENEKKRDEED